GLTCADVVLTVRAAPVGVLAGIGGASLLGAVTAAGLVVPRARRFYLEERIVGASFGQMIHAVFVRIPLGTAVPEELLFRGVLLRLPAPPPPPLQPAIPTPTLLPLPPP